MHRLTGFLCQSQGPHRETVYLETWDDNIWVGLIWASYTCKFPKILLARNTAFFPLPEKNKFYFSGNCRKHHLNEVTCNIMLASKFHLSTPLWLQANKQGLMSAQPEQGNIASVSGKIAKTCQNNQVAWLLCTSRKGENISERGYLGYYIVVWRKLKQDE